MVRGAGSVGCICQVVPGPVVFFLCVTDAAASASGGFFRNQTFAFIFTSLPTLTKGGSRQHLYHLFYLKQRLAPSKGTWVSFPIIPPHPPCELFLRNRAGA